MRRLIAYLFIVLCLGSAANIDVYSEEPSQTQSNNIKFENCISGNYNGPFKGLENYYTIYEVDLENKKIITTNVDFAKKRSPINHEIEINDYEKILTKNKKRGHKKSYQIEFNKKTNQITTITNTDYHGRLETKIGYEYCEKMTGNWKIPKIKIAKKETKDKKKKNLAKAQEEVKKKKLKKASAKKEFLLDLESVYGKDCEISFFSFFKEGFERGTKEYENCLISKNNQRITEKKKLAKEQKTLEERLSKMGQMERIQYQCEKVFNFYKHSKKFKDCNLKVYVAEAEARKIELEKEVLLAQLETSKLKLETAKLKLKVSKENNEAKRIAKLEKQRTTDFEKQKRLLVKKETKNAKGLGSFLDLVSVGLQIYSLTSSTPSMGSGSSASSALQCFTSGMFQYCN